MEGMNRFKKSIVSVSRISSPRAVLYVGDQRIEIAPAGVTTLDGMVAKLSGRQVFSPDEIIGDKPDGLLGVLVDFAAGWTAFIYSGK